MSKTTITELRRTGQGFYAETPIKFEWDSATRTGLQGDIEFELAVKTSRFEVGEEVVEQVMAATWQPFQISGRWKDSYAGQGFAELTMRQFAQLVGRTPLVRLQIDRLSWVGILTNARFNYVTADNIAWSAVLSPHLNEHVGQFQPTKPITPIARPLQHHADAVSAVVDEIQAVNTGIATYPAGTEDVVDAQPLIAALTDARAKINSVTAATEDAERSLLTAATALRRARNAGLDLLLSIRAKHGILMAALDNPIHVLRFNEWMRTVQAKTVQAAGLALVAEQDMRRRAERKPRAIHVAKAAESLERIAMRYYGNADAWSVIYAANALDSIVLDGGQELIIPERSS